MESLKDTLNSSSRQELATFSDKDQSKSQQGGQPQETAFPNDFPISTWLGRSSSIIELQSGHGSTCWIYIPFENPDNYKTLKIQIQGNHEIIFFNPSAHKFLRLTDDSLCWSYYSSGPFQTLENGSWISRNQSLAQIEGSKISYGTDMAHQIIEKVIQNKKVKNSQLKEDALTDRVEDLKMLDLDSLRQQTKVDPKKQIENQKAWKEIDSLLKQFYANSDIKKFRETIVNSKGKEGSEIKKSEIVSIFEEILSVYELEFEHLRNLLNQQNIYLYPLENMNDMKFILGIVIPEICLYPKTLIQALNLRALVFCGEMKQGDSRLGSKHLSQKLYLNCKEKNIIKIQKGFHEGIFEMMGTTILSKLPEFKHTWKSINPPEIKNSQVSKEIKGFLSVNAAQNFHKDVAEIYFALMKNPPTILNHQDACIAQKGQLLTNVLDVLYSESIDNAWWERITEYEDVMELALGTREYFKEAHFPDDQK